MINNIWKIEWTDDMSVGIPLVDEDHKRFIYLLNALNRSIIDQMDRAEIRKILQLILDDAEQHFALEEWLFKEWQYPETERHSEMHKQALKAFKGIIEGTVAYGFESEWIEAGLKIKEILIGHILNEDSKYAEFYRNSNRMGQDMDHAPRNR